MEQIPQEHPHTTHQRTYLTIIGLALVGPLLLIPTWRLGDYAFIVEQAYFALVVWFLILTLPTSSSKEGAALMFGSIFAIMGSLIALTDIEIVSNAYTFMYRLVFTVPLYMVSALLLTLPAMTHRKYFPIGVIIVLLLNFGFNWAL